MTDKDQFLLYEAEYGQVKFDVRLSHESVWLTQADMSELFQVKPQNITQHLKNISVGYRVKSHVITRNHRHVCYQPRLRSNS